MGQLHAFGLFIITTVAFTITVPVSAAALEEAHSRTELDLPPAVAEAIRETGEVTGDHATTATKRFTKVVAAPERAQEAPAPVGPSTAAPSSPEATVSAEGEDAASADSAESAEEDLAMNELLAILDEEESVESTLTFGQGQSIGTAGASPLGRAVPVTAFAVFCFLGLLAHPRTRKLALGRLTGASDLRSQLDEIAMHSTRELGAGQRVVALQVDGHRVLVGVSEGRMDLLHTWEDPQDLLEDPDRLTRTMFDPGLILDQARNSSTATVDTNLEGMRARVADSTPSARELLAAFGKNSYGASSGLGATRRSEPLPEVEEETPWWMEGASEVERVKIRNQASVTESVMSKLRAARTRGESTASERPLSGPTRRDRRPAATPAARPHRGLPRMVLGLMAGLFTALMLLTPEIALAADGMQLSLSGDALSAGGDATGASTAIKLLITMTMLAVAPAIILSMTSFTRLIVIFSLMRQAIGVQQAPPNQILIGLAIFLTWFIMGPTFNQVNDTAVQPYFDGEMTEGEALETGMVPMRKFMMKNTRKKDLALFLRLSGTQRPQTKADVPTRALVPAFIISELKTAFQIGFLIYIPFLIIDLVVATVLLAMGMMVLPPVVISLPFKLLLFVFIDGWNLLIGSVVQSFA